MNNLIIHESAYYTILSLDENQLNLTSMKSYRGSKTYSIARLLKMITIFYVKSIVFFIRNVCLGCTFPLI